MKCGLTKKEVPLADLGDSAVGDSTGKTVTIAVGRLLCCWSETRVVTLGLYDDSDSRAFLAHRVIHLLAGLSLKGQLAVFDHLVLALRYAVPNYEYVFGKPGVLAHGLPRTKKILRHITEIRYFLSSLLNTGHSDVLALAGLNVGSHSNNAGRPNA